MGLGGMEGSVGHKAHKAQSTGGGTEGSRKAGKNKRGLQTRKGERGEERFWALGKREQTKGPKRIWKDSIGVNALPATKEPGLVSRAYFGWWSRG